MLVHGEYLVQNNSKILNSGCRLYFATMNSERIGNSYINLLFGEIGTVRLAIIYLDLMLFYVQQCLTAYEALEFGHRYLAMEQRNIYDHVGRRYCLRLGKVYLVQ